MITSCSLADQLGKKCSRYHLHAQSLDGRATSSAVYPDTLCDAICLGVRLQEKDGSAGQACYKDLSLKQLQSLDLKFQQHVGTSVLHGFESEAVAVVGSEVSAACGA